MVTLVLQGLDVEPQGGTDLADILAVEFLEDSGLPRRIQTPLGGKTRKGRLASLKQKGGKQDQKAHFPLLLLNLLDDRKQAHPMKAAEALNVGRKGPKSVSLV